LVAGEEFVTLKVCQLEASGRKLIPGQSEEIFEKPLAQGRGHHQNPSN